MMIQRNEFGWGRFLVPVVATLFYLGSLIIWFFGFFSLVMGIAPHDAPLTFIPMVFYPLSIVPAILMSFIYAFRHQSEKSRRAALFPLAIGLWALVSYGWLVLSY